MYDVNPQSHRYYLEDLERQMLLGGRDCRHPAGRGNLFASLRNYPRVVAIVLFCLLLGGVTGGNLI